jgi:hypothetical protein
MAPPLLPTRQIVARGGTFHNRIRAQASSVGVSAQPTRLEEVKQLRTEEG